MRNMKVVTKGEFKPKENDGFLFITVDVESPAVSILSAKRAALESPDNPYGKYAGIEKWGGIYTTGVDKKTNAPQQAMQFKLTRPIPGIGIGI